MLHTRIAGTVGPAALAWYGNVAKMRVIERIASGPPIRVLDYGAGDGQGWSSVLYENPGLDLTCFEPCPSRAKALRLNVPAARIFGSGAAEIAGRFDLIVSFSVFEHVKDRAAYLAHAKRLLKPGGRLILNYDDGHFRRPGRREALRNLLAPMLPVRHFQARVIRDEADRLIATAGLRIVRARYENLASMKALAPTIPPADRAEFAAMWLELEDRLNAEFATEGPEQMGDRVNLWRDMGSRTLELAH